MTNDKRTVGKQKEEFIQELSNYLTNDGEYSRDGQCLLEKDFEWLGELFLKFITAERQRAETLEREKNALQGAYSSMFEQRNELKSRLQEAEAEIGREKTAYDEMVCEFNSKLQEAEKELSDVRKRFDERYVTPNEYEKYLIQKPLREKIAELEKELASAKELWADAQSACKKHALRADELEKEVERLKLAEDFDSSLLDDSNKKLIDYRKKIKELEARLADKEVIIAGFPESSYKWRLSKAQDEIADLRARLAEREKTLKQVDYVGWEGYAEGLCRKLYEAEASLSRHKQTIEELKIRLGEKD